MRRSLSVPALLAAPLALAIAACMPTPPPIPPPSRAWSSAIKRMPIKTREFEVRPTFLIAAVSLGWRAARHQDRVSALSISSGSRSRLICSNSVTASG